MAEKQKRKMVTLVTLEVLTPYKAGEVFSVTEEEAEKLLTRNTEKTDFGPKYPRVKVRKFDSRVDGERLLEERSLNVKAHNALQSKLRPDAAPVKAVSAEFESPLTDLLDKAGYDEAAIAAEEEAALRDQEEADRKRRAAGRSVSRDEE